MISPIQKIRILPRLLTQMRISAASEAKRMRSGGFRPAEEGRGQTQHVAVETNFDKKRLRISSAVSTVTAAGVSDREISVRSTDETSISISSSRLNRFKSPGSVCAKPDVIVKSCSETVRGEMKSRSAMA